MSPRNSSLALAALVLLLSPGCDRPAGPPPAVAPAPGPPQVPHGFREEFLWGAAVLPGDLAPTPGAPAPWGFSALFVDFDFLRAHPLLPGRLNLPFAAPDLAAELGLLARDIHAVWMFDVGSTVPTDPEPIQTILVARVSSASAAAEAFEKRAKAGTIRRLTVRDVVWYEEPVTRSAVAFLDGRLVRVRGSNWLEQAMEVKEGKRRSLAAAEGLGELLDACGPEVATFYVTNNRRYSRLRVLGEGLRLGASVTTPAHRQGLMAFDTPEHAERGIVPLRMQFVEEADEGEVERKGALLRMTSPLVPEPRRAAPPLDAAGKVVWGASWAPADSASFTVDLTAARSGGGFPGTGSGRERAAVPGLDQAGLVACHEVLSLHENSWRLDAALLEAARLSDLRDALAAAAAAGGWKPCESGPLRGWIDGDGGVRAVWEGRLLWTRDRAALERVLAARYRQTPSLADRAPWAAKLLAAEGPPTSALLSAAPDPDFPGALLTLSAQVLSGRLTAAEFPDPDSAEKARASLASAAHASVERRETLLIRRPPEK